MNSTANTGITTLKIPDAFGGDAGERVGILELLRNQAQFTFVFRPI